MSANTNTNARARADVISTTGTVADGEHGNGALTNNANIASANGSISNGAIENVSNVQDGNNAIANGTTIGAAVANLQAHDPPVPAIESSNGLTFASSRALLPSQSITNRAVWLASLKRLFIPFVAPMQEVTAEETQLLWGEVMRVVDLEMQSHGVPPVVVTRDRLAIATAVWSAMHSEERVIKAGGLGLGRRNAIFKKKLGDGDWHAKENKRRDGGSGGAGGTDGENGSASAGLA